jgi:hypothetical protein
MSGPAAPVTVHSGIFVQSRLPIVLHRIIPAGSLSLHNIGMIEAGLLGIVISQTLFFARGNFTEYAIGAAVGAGAYHMAPP